MRNVLGNIFVGVLGFFAALIGLVLVVITSILGSALAALPFVIVIGFIYWLFF